MIRLNRMKKQRFKIVRDPSGAWRVGGGCESGEKSEGGGEREQLERAREIQVQRRRKRDGQRAEQRSV